MPASDTSLILGNVAPVVTIKYTDGSESRSVRPELGNQVTEVHFPEGASQPEHSALALSTNNDRTLTRIGREIGESNQRFAIAIRDVEDLWWGAHSDQSPAWVESDDEQFAEAVALYFGDGCVVGRPDGWRETRPMAGGSQELDRFLTLNGIDPDAWLGFGKTEYLLTTVGRDALHSQHMNTAAQPAAFNYMALTANATAPSAASTTLTAEIATGGGGLVRAQATYAHTGSTNTTTLTKTFTANGSDALPVTLAKIGIFNASSVGTLGYETLLNATATLTISGDNVTITETVTAG